MRAGELSGGYRAREDRSVTESSSPLETALDLFVYVPVGLAVTLSEEVPRLAAKGRDRLGPTLATARMVGQFAVGQGRRMAAGSGRPTAATSRPAGTRVPPGGSTPGPGGAGAARDGAGTPPGPVAGTPPDSVAGTVRARSARPAAAGTAPAAGRPTTTPPGGGGAAAGAAIPAAHSLAIPGYDSLSASQVVQRLASLTAEELDAVGRYEAAGRGRRTILARVAQLQGR